MNFLQKVKILIICIFKKFKNVSKYVILTYEGGQLFSWDFMSRGFLGRGNELDLERHKFLEKILKKKLYSNFRDYLGIFIYFYPIY